jgi:crotonobetainyl-CoA:carnitine CoA-transferase CaiB-like acyl-CoA transferase
VVAISDAEIRRLESAIEVAILDQPDYATHELRESNSYQLGDMLAEVFARQDSQDWIDVLRAAGVAAMIPKVEPNNEAFHRDPVNQRIGRIAEVQDQTGVKTREASIMVRVRVRVRVRGAAVAPHCLTRDLGVDTDSVLEKFGYTSEQISSLRERGSIK